MVCEEKEPKIPETTQQTSAEEPKERTPEEDREISSKEAPAENEDG